jgi:hypothetical protein
MCEFLDNLFSIPKVMSLDNNEINTFGEIRFGNLLNWCSSK